MRVRLSRQEMANCEQAAALRWQLARASGVTNQRKDKGRSDADLDLIGIKAETAVAKVLDVHHNVFQMGVDSGADMFLGDISIDVKSTFYESGKMLFKSLDAFRADCCVLVTATQDADVMNVAGYSSKAHFEKNAETADLGHGPCFIMTQDRLRGIESLWAYHKTITLDNGTT